MKVVARSKSVGSVAYLTGVVEERDMVYVGAEGLELPKDAISVPLASLMTSPYGDWEEVEEDADGDTAA